MSRQKTGVSSEKVDVRALASLVAAKLLKNNHFATFRDTKEVLLYSDGVYKQGGEAYIEEMIQQNVDHAEVSQHLCKEVVAHVQRSTYVDREAFTNRENPHLVLDNCLFNLEKLTEEPFTHEYLALSKMPARYDPAANCPTFLKFIKEILSEEDVQGVQEELGAILAQRYLTKKLSIYLGDTDTGKTTLINAILAFLGAENVSSVSIQDLASKNRFAIAELYGKLANIRDDLPKDVIYSVGKLKELTGGFQVQGEKKFRDPFDFVNHAYLIFTCNVLPPVDEDDNAFYNRVVIRRFQRRFGGKDKPDRELVNKLTTPEELSGILNFALEGLRRLRDNGWNFTSTASTEETRLEYKRRSDPIWAFVQDRLDDSDSEAYEPKETLYNSFKDYCEANGFQNPGKDFFYKHLGDKITVQSGRRGPKGGQSHCFVGVKLRAQQILGGENPDYHDYPDYEKHAGSHGSQGSHPPDKMLSTGGLGQDGICELCGESGLLTKTSEGHYVCAKCRKEAQP